MEFPRAVRVAAGSAEKAAVAESRPSRQVLFPEQPKASPIYPASGAAFSRVGLPASSRRRLRVAAEAEARVDPLEAERLELARVELRLLPAELPVVDPADPLEPVPAQVKAVPVAAGLVEAVAARTRSSIPRMAKFPTLRQLARS